MRLLLMLTVAFGLAGCGFDNPEAPQALDQAYFECNVEPILIESCAFYACHGDPDRAFFVFGPNRIRLEVDPSLRRSPLTADEHQANYEAALGFASPEVGYDAPLLTMKPLSPEAGGGDHDTLDRFAGQDVFDDPLDPAFQTILAWTQGATEDPSCAR